MTEQQKKALGEIRALAEKTISQAEDKTTSPKMKRALAAYRCKCTLARLDAIEADGKCKPERQPIYEGGEQVQWSAYSCDKCGCKTIEKYPYCPGCGREVER